MKIEDFKESMMQGMLSSYHDVKWHIFAKLLTEEESRTLDPQCKVVTIAAHEYALVVDFKRICKLDNVTSFITDEMLKTWGISVDEAKDWAGRNMNREAVYGCDLLRQNSKDVFDGRLPVWSIHFKSALAARYAAAIVNCKVLLDQVYGMLGGAYNIYFFGAGQKDMILCKAADVRGLNMGIPFWWDHCYPPRVKGPGLHYDGRQIAYCAYDDIEVQLNNNPPKMQGRNGLTDRCNNQVQKVHVTDYEGMEALRKHILDEMMYKADKITVYMQKGKNTLDIELSHAD